MPDLKSYKDRIIYQIKGIRQHRWTPFRLWRTANAEGEMIGKFLK